MLLFMEVCRHWDEALTSCRITHVRLVLLIEDFDDPFTLHPGASGKLYQLNCGCTEFVNRGSGLKLTCRD